ncbi:hypothetical protein LOTGIDRAFT_161912 [Lottia gigantea]|uniref:Uncharacterized protein n=1 Tax=Lottia gigantea TaxID=225164 RepID=V4A9D9_LOTGI|nr:hypothetical protein LOTGIDRAFT_161912 [Lottia gigantea]ESO93347.1 hypothetical protein LOTGIDRAFT_161912 [Lottia gigantea]
MVKLKRNLKYCNISVKYFKYLLVLLVVIYIWTTFSFHGNSRYLIPQIEKIQKDHVLNIPVNQNDDGINGLLTNKTPLKENKWKPSVQEYYKSHYGNCQFSVVKENKISCKNILETGRGLILPQDEKRLCNLTKISELFRQINGYDNKYITNEELDFPLAFGIRLCDSENQVEQLLRTIYRPHNFYCLHVDKQNSSTKTYQHLKSIAKCFDNVIILSQIRTVYGSIKLVYADLLCMEKALNSKVNWKYHLNMAGSEMPIKTNLEIVKICKILKGRNGLESQPMPARSALRY